jgi:hypothetical protein
MNKMINLFKVILVIMILQFANLQVCKSETVSDSLNFGKKYGTVALIGLGYPFSGKSNAFFDTFNQYFQIDEILVKSIPSVFFRFKGEFIKNFRFGIDVEYFRQYFNESYYVPIPDTLGGGFRDYSQNMYLNNLPIMLIAEYIPFDLPYKTYFGTSIGLNIQTIQWEETYSSSIKVDTRSGGEHFNGLVYSPAIKLYTGMELKFDRHSVKSFINSLVLETAVIYNYGNIDIFKQVKEQFNPIPNELEQKYSIVPYNIMINLGVTLDFDPITQQSNI